MPIALHSIFNIVGVYGPERGRTGDDVNTIFKYIKSFRRSGFQVSGGILHLKKRYWRLHKAFVLETS